MKFFIKVGLLMLITYFTKIYGNVSIPDESGTLESMRRANPELGLNTTDIIRLYNYDSEEYTIVTEDGFFIKIQRIIPKIKKRVVMHPVLLMHGLNCYSASWVDNGNRSLAFILSDYGYDVWLGNIRGNPYGREHLKFTTDSKEFWTFSFHENGLYDLPAIINFILRTTGFKQLYYVGHSMGTTMMFTLLSSKPEFNNKLKGFMALAPVAYVTHVLPEFKVVIENFNFVKMLLSMANQYELAPGPNMHAFFMNLFCRNGEKKCQEFLFTIAGNDISLLNKTRIPLFISHCSVGTSLNTLTHYMQIHLSQNFSEFDYESKKKNLKHYGKELPPLYDLKLVVAPVALFWGKNDFLADVKDVKRLKQELPNVVLSYEVPFINFTHADFLWAMNGQELLYNKIIETMESLVVHKQDRP